MTYVLPVPDHKLNAGLSCSLQGLVGLVCAPAGTVLPVDLKDLVTETQASQGRRGVRLHQLDKQSLREKMFGGTENRLRLMVEEKKNKKQSNSTGRRQGRESSPRLPAALVAEYKLNNELLQRTYYL